MVPGKNIWTLEAFIEHYEKMKEEQMRNIENRFNNVDQRFEESKQNVANALVSSEKAVDKAFNTAEKAVTQALVAQKELSQTVQVSSDKAITKAEEAQKAYNVGHNDLARKMDDQYKLMLPRVEADSRDKNVEEKLKGHGELINLLSSRLDLMSGAGAGKEQGFKNIKDIVYIVIALASFAIGYFVFKK